MHEGKRLRRGGCRQMKGEKFPYFCFSEFGVCKTHLNPHICYLSLESNIWILALSKNDNLKSISTIVYYIWLNISILLQTWWNSCWSWSLIWNKYIMKAVFVYRFECIDFSWPWSGQTQRQCSRTCSAAWRGVKGGTTWENQGWGLVFFVCAAPFAYLFCHQRRNSISKDSEGIKEEKLVTILEKLDCKLNP